MVSDSSSEEEDMSRFASVAVSSESLTKAARELPAHKKSSEHKSAGRFGLRDHGASLSIIENKLYDALASRLADDSDCQLDSHSDTAIGNSDSDSDSREEAGSNVEIPQAGAADPMTDQPSPFQIFRAAPKGQPITFVTAAACVEPGLQDDPDKGPEGPLSAAAPEQQPLTRRERVHAMKQEARRQRKAAEKLAKAKVEAAKEAAAAKRRGEPQLPAPPPLPFDSEARALRVADTGGAHLRTADEAEEMPGAAEQPGENRGRPQSLQEAADRGIEVTDEERKEFKRRWRIAKNERRKARNAIGRAARQVKKAAHHQVKHNIKKEKQARRDRNAQRELNAAASVTADPSGSKDSADLAGKDSAVKQPKQPKAKGEALKTARKKISVKRGKFSKQRCEKRNKQLRRDNLTQCIKST